MRLNERIGFSKIEMNQTQTNRTLFITRVGTLVGKSCARLLIESLRSFGGAMQNCPFWIFEAFPEKTACQDLIDLNIKVLPLNAPAPQRDFLFGEKVYACAQAELLAPPDTQSLVWIDPICLIVQPPLLYGLTSDYDAAFRPVHIRNVGLPANQPLDTFWQKISDIAGVKDIPMAVESFVDGQRLHAYFNSHAFAVNPQKGLMKRWLACFESLINDQEFLSTICQDENHQIFLFQAALSVVAAGSIDEKRLLILPPVYNYPYNLYQSIPAKHRVKALNDLVSLVYEDRMINPRKIDDVEIRDPLYSWLMQRENILPVF